MPAVRTARDENPGDGRRALAATTPGGRGVQGATTPGGRGVAVTLAVALALATALLAAGPAHARTFYVDPSGSDHRSGLSPARAWRTVKRVNRARLRPGDRVLMRGRATFANTLMPPASGGRGQPILFGSFGGGRARLPGGVWFRRRHDLAFDHLALFGAGLVGHGHRVALTNSAIAHTRLGVVASGTNWWIAGNRVRDVGDSGLILTGRLMAVTGNRIERTGRDRAIHYGKHGIYLKAADAQVSGNVIQGFVDNGISVRYRNSRIEGNQIAGGPIGIGWFQYDRRAGRSSWVSNSITDTTSAGIYVSKADRAGTTRESFVIRTNVLRPRSGRPLDLGQTLGSYDVLGNLAG
jgi:hypothetical protein